MTRARATALALVNWKGVFYERYLLDRHVTVLEGSNGAGKTTVMIAAYVVLLPDMSRLRFTNLGESGATGADRGIWGRLGEPGRASYSAMEVSIGDERLVMGVRLERKAEPTIELTPFVITNVDLKARLKDVLLRSDGEHDEVPDLSDIRAAVVERGGELTVFASAKEYFSWLFDRGVTPLRLATEEERAKMNDMLKTSMTGGISRALTTELRAFLLKEETGLADTLSRMRKNLDACHRTRTEVGESRGLEREIAGVFEAGEGMFTSALHAVRAAALERSASAEEARARRDDAAREVREIERAGTDARVRQGAIAGRLEGTRAARLLAVTRRDVVARAADTRRRIVELEPKLADAARTEREASAALDVASGERERAKEARDRARELYDRAAYGVGNLQSGLEELHRSVHKRRLVARRLAEARELLQPEPLSEADLETALGSARARLVEIDAGRARAARAAASTAQERERFERAWAALEAVDPTADRANAANRARSAVEKTAELEARAARVPELVTELAGHEKSLDRQRAAKERAAALAIELAEDGAAVRVAARVRTELEQGEERVRADELRSHDEERAAQDARKAASAERATAVKLEATVARWTALSASISLVEAETGTPIASRDAAMQARMLLGERREQLRQESARLRSTYEDCLREAGELDAGAGTYPADLLRIREEVEGELLGARFEELEPDEAARVEAELGPLANALIVDDPIATAGKLAGAERDVADVLLLRPEEAVAIVAAAAEAHGRDVVVRESWGARVSRIPDKASIGRRARDRRAAERRAEAEDLASRLEESIRRQHELDAVITRADSLVADADLLGRGDPANEIEAHAARASGLEAEAETHLETSSQSATAAARGRARCEALRELLAEAYVLDEPDHETAVARAREGLDAARAARDELAATAEARRALRELELDLREAPPDEAAIAAAASRLEELDARRDTTFRLIEALEDLVEHRDFVGRSEDEAHLEEKTALLSELTSQLDGARTALADREEALSSAEQRWEDTAGRRRAAAAALEGVRGRAAELLSELQRDGLVDVDAATLEVAQSALGAREAEIEALETEDRTITKDAAQLAERLAHAKRAAAAAETKLAEEEAQARPLRSTWLELEAEATAGGLLKRAPSESQGAVSSAQLWADAQAKSKLLVERVRRARGGADGAEEIERALEASTQGHAHVRAWIVARLWLKKRLPGQIAEVDDPIEALGRLRENLDVLERRLSRQEGDLRGASEDVARGIDVRLRRAKGQIRRLNQSLRDVHFGSIGAIRVEMRRIERMDGVLRALREGEAQELLFVSNVPIEEALDEIFKRYGGGRSGGQRILDYREYAELAVEIQRAGSDTWEVAAPTRLSTGEAIGVGAALMMVVLTEWERDGNLLRAAASSGTLRFLFLDEANRLSQDNLGVLFSLCENLDLQLLIAAPEVARAEGNTTYRLVRTVDAQGREEVVVSGRRTVA